MRALTVIYLCDRKANYELIIYHVMKRLQMYATSSRYIRHAQVTRSTLVSGQHPS